MNVVEAIESRRSIRKFKEAKLEKEAIEKIISAGIKAPSGKNRQPWRFIVVEGYKKDELVELMRENIYKIKKEGKSIGSCEGSIKAMDESSAVVLVFNPYSKIEEDYSYHRGITDVQSIGACIQNMILVSQDLELGTLWICDVSYISEIITSWATDEKYELIAALAIGYPDQNPYPRPRKEMNEVTTWLE
ncbi:nitroreductase [Gottschalkia purinilytica]|uniref:Nitroreductase n=1 Tax=Gottschalkia purinilytica TaxID=1503 RepID=A0A0L0WFG3_GOTPU|nr:nitroreductase [Gottschalkia purinilytica]KNF10209.1 nitroreductase [Gottschalkia purinilytica]